MITLIDPSQPIAMQRRRKPSIARESWIDSDDPQADHDPCFVCPLKDGQSRYVKKEMRESGKEKGWEGGGGNGVQKCAKHGCFGTHAYKPSTQDILRHD